MDMRAALRARLLAAAPVSTLVGTRVTWVTRPQLSGLPAITLQLIVGDHVQHLKAFEKQQARVQLDAWATKQTDATALVAASINALAAGGEFNEVQFGHAMFEGETDLVDRLGETDIYRVMIEVIFRHKQV